MGGGTGTPAGGFGELLRRHRAQAGLTQEQLAERSGLSVRTIADMERGRTRRPYQRSVLLLADALQLSGPLCEELVRAARGVAPDGSAPPPTPMGRPPQVVPRQLPTAAGDFTGRTSQQRALDAALDRHWGPAVKLLVISGAAGVGKTALALHWAHRVADKFPDGQLYVDLQGATPGLPPLAPLDVLGRFLRALGADPTRLPTSLDEASSAFRTQTARQRLLVLLDNARDPTQVRPLLPATPDSTVLVTSRPTLSALDGASHLHLEILRDAESLQLLGRLAGEHRLADEPLAAAQVAGLCGHLPLALRIAGARLAARPAWPLATLAQRLADQQHRLDELDLGDLGVRASFALSHQHLAESPDPLDQAAAQAFGLLGLPDGLDLSIPAAARLLDQSQEQAERVLERLVDAQLLETRMPGRYRFHDLLRLYARDHAAATYPEAEHAAALTRAFGHYTATAWQTVGLLRPGDQRLAHADHRWRTGGLRFADATAALGWLEAERANLLAAIQQTTTTPGVPSGIATQLGQALYGFFDVRSYWADWVQVNHTTLQAARKTGDRAAQAQAHNDLGRACHLQGQYAEALDHHQQALALRRELGDRHGQANSLNGLGNVYRRLGRDTQAVDCYQQALTLNRDLGDRHGQAISLNNLGVVYVQLGRYREALDPLQQALVLRRELGDRHGQATSLNNLGEIHERLESYREALDHHQHALILRRELGDRSGQASSLDNLGVVYVRLGRYREALDHHQQALTLFRELGHSHGQAEALRDLGDALHGARRLGQAMEAWREALELCQALGIPEADELRERLRSPAAPATKASDVGRGCRKVAGRRQAVPPK
jgi:tetratricopeptide (TPR) repeat protein